MWSVKLMENHPLDDDRRGGANSYKYKGREIERESKGWKDERKENKRAAKKQKEQKLWPMSHLA